MPHETLFVHWISYFVSFLLEKNMLWYASLFFLHSIEKIIFLISPLKTCCGYSSEAPHWGASDENPWHMLCLFVCVCVGVLWPSQPIRVIICMVSLPNHTFFLGRPSPLWDKPVLEHILSPETDNCPSWIIWSWRKRKWSILFDWNSILAGKVIFVLFFSVIGKKVSGKKYWEKKYQFYLNAVLMLQWFQSQNKNVRKIYF